MIHAARPDDVHALPRDGGDRVRVPSQDDDTRGELLLLLLLLLRRLLLRVVRVRNPERLEHGPLQRANVRDRVLAVAVFSLRVEGPYKAMSGWSSKASEAEWGKGVEGGDRKRGVGGQMRREVKSSRIVVHHADAVVWGPV